MELCNQNGDTIHNQEDIEAACVAFYSDFYTAPRRGGNTVRCEQEILDAIPPRISPLAASNLSQPLSELELHRAACALAKEKAPGPDGLSINFFTIYWSIIGEDFHQMILSSVATRRFPRGVTKGLITLIPKGGDL